MSTTTTQLTLTKPIGTEQRQLSIWNANWSAVDAAFSASSLGAGGAQVAVLRDTAMTPTYTAAGKTINLTPTWNAAGLSVYGYFLNVTNTASGTGSRLASLQVGGNPLFEVDGSTNASAATGVKIVGNAAGSRVALVALSTGTNEGLDLDAKGSGTVRINVASGTGGITLGAATSVSSTVTVTSASATALTVGLNGATNPAFQVDASAVAQVAGLKVSGAASGGNVTLQVTDTALNAGLNVNAKGTGILTLNGGQSGGITCNTLTTFSAGATFSASQPLTFGGSNTITGTPTWANGQTFPAVTTTTSVSFGTSVLSSTAIATLGPYSATQFAAFASTISGAVIEGYGTTNDVTLMNRSGTAVLGVTANTSNVTLAGALTIAGALSGVTTLSTSGAITTTVQSGTAYVGGPNGATNPTFRVTTPASNGVTGVEITGNTLGTRPTIATISSGTNEGLDIDSKGTGALRLNVNATGAITLGQATTVSGALTIAGALSGVTTLTASGAVSLATTLTAAAALSILPDTGTRASTISVLKIFDQQNTTDANEFSATVVIQGKNGTSQTAPLLTLYNYAANSQNSLYIDHNGSGYAIQTTNRVYFGGALTVSAGGAAITGNSSVAGGTLVVNGTSVVNASKLSVQSGVTTDSNNAYMQGWAFGGNSVYSQLAGYTTTAITTAKTIFTAIDTRGVWLFVHGNDGTNYFADLIVTGYGASTITVINSYTEEGAPSARTYSKSANSAVLQLAMASGTYAVTCVGLILQSR